MTDLLSLKHGLALLPALVKAKEWSSSIHPLDETRASTEGCDGVVTGVEAWTLLLVYFSEHGVNYGQELHDPLI